MLKLKFEQKANNSSIDYYSDYLNLWIYNGSNSPNSTYIGISQCSLPHKKDNHLTIISRNIRDEMPCMNKR